MDIIQLDDDYVYAQTTRHTSTKHTTRRFRVDTVNFDNDSKL